MRDDVYRRIAVAEGKRPRPRYGPRCMRLAGLEASGARLRRGVRRGIARITMTGTSLGEHKAMTKQTLYGGVLGLALLTGLSACTDPYDPAQRTVGGGLLGAATGAAIGAAVGGGHGAALGAAIGGATGAVAGAASTPPPPPPPGYYPPPGGYYGGYPPPPPPY